MQIINKMLALLAIIISTSALYSIPRVCSSLRFCSTPEPSPEIDLRILQQQFAQLATQNSDRISYKQFIKWDEILALMEDGLFEKEEFQNIWQEVVGDIKTSKCNLEQFIEINRIIDDQFDEDEEDLDIDELNDLQSRLTSSTTSASDIDTINSHNTHNSDNDDNNDEIDDVWDPAFDPTTILNPEFLTYLNEYFTKYSSNNQLNYNAFYNWQDIKDLLADGNIDNDILNNIWIESQERLIVTGIDNKEEITAKLLKYKEKTVNCDTFLRMNIRLNDIIEEIDEAINNLNDEDYEQYYRTEYQSLVTSTDTHTNLLTLKQLLSWQDLKDTMRDCNIKKQEIVDLWENSLKLQSFTPHHTTGIPTAETLKNNKGFGRPPSSTTGSSEKGAGGEVMGISEDEFVNFNFMLDEYLKAKAPPGPVDWEPLD